MSAQFSERSTQLFYSNYHFQSLYRLPNKVWRSSIFVRATAPYIAKYVLIAVLPANGFSSPFRFKARCCRTILCRAGAVKIPSKRFLTAASCALRRFTWADLLIISLRDTEKTSQCVLTIKFSVGGECVLLIYVLRTEPHFFLTTFRKVRNSADTGQNIMKGSPMALKLLNRYDNVY